MSLAILLHIESQVNKTGIGIQYNRILEDY